MDAEPVIELVTTAIGAFGLGAVIQSLIQHWLGNKKYVREREYKEKRDAYLGFLDAVTKSEISPSPENAISGGYWINRCKLIAPLEITRLLDKYLQTNPQGGAVHPERKATFDLLLEEMHKDLKRT